jgi:hypothetical protein
MQTLFRSLSRWMLLVMLTTVLAPGFGWEVAGGMLASAQAAPAEAHGDHHQHALPHDSQPMAQLDEHAVGMDCAEMGLGGTGLGSCGGPDMPPCDDLQHHCCPGHVLSHLSAALHAAPSFLLPISQNIAVDRSNRQFSSRVPEGLERPPRVVFA